MNIFKRNITYIFLFIAFVIYITILTIKSYLFQFSYVLISYVIIIVLYEITKRKKINLEINSQILNYSLISLTIQLISIEFGIHFYSVFIFLLLLLLYLILILKSIDCLFIQNWKQYHWKSRIINILVVFHVFPILILYLFFLINYITTPKNVESISPNELYYIDTQTGKEISIDSLAQRTVDRIIKSKKKDE